MQQDLNLLWFVDNFYTKLKLTTNNVHLVKKQALNWHKRREVRGFAPVGMMRGWNAGKMGLGIS